MSTTYKVATVMDVFSYNCFKYEFDAVQLHPKNFADQITKDMKLVFIETTSKGPGKGWNLFNTNKLQYNKKRLKTIKKLCNKFEIPLVCWCKEDPVRFKRFMPLAKFFDVITTTDKRCVQKYKNMFPGKKIGTIPFAAQPDIHKYAPIEYRDLGVCFAGTYTTQWPHRMELTHELLIPSMDYNLVIYDRKISKGKRQSFPKQYTPCVHGGIPYTDLVDYYSRFRVFLNVNAIVASPTMFSRRVFELLCCGTPVISGPSTGMENIFRGIVLVSNNRKTTTKHLELLFSDDVYWNRVSNLGRSLVLRKHTYAHRIRKVFRLLGQKVPNKTIERIKKFNSMAVEVYDDSIA